MRVILMGPSAFFVCTFVCGMKATSKSLPSRAPSRRHASDEKDTPARQTHQSIVHRDGTEHDVPAQEATPRGHCEAGGRRERDWRVVPDHGAPHEACSTSTSTSTIQANTHTAKADHVMSSGSRYKRQLTTHADGSTKPATQERKEQGKEHVTRERSVGVNDQRGVVRVTGTAALDGSGL
jgi:hypothetical protein